MTPQFNDPIFGLLEISLHYEWEYLGQIRFLPDETVDISINIDELAAETGSVGDEEFSTTMERARAVFAKFKAYEPILRKTVAARSFVGDWTPPEGTTRETFSLEEFESKMKLNGIAFHNSKIFSVIYDFDDLFNGQLCEEYLNDDFTLCFP